jgi:hypothetical protein
MLKMNPVLVVTFLFINSLLQQCKHKKNFLLQVHCHYWWVEWQQQMATLLIDTTFAVFSNSAKIRSW